VKLLLLLAIGLLVVAWLMRGSKSLQSPKSSSESARRDDARAMPSREGEPMVPCAQCGIHIPVSESVVDAEGTAYCSDEHRRLHT
jgi:uncharacterized protein